MLLLFSHRLQDGHGSDGGSDPRPKDQEVQEELEVGAQLDLVLVLVPDHLLQGLHARAHRPEDAVGRGWTVNRCLWIIVNYFKYLSLEWEGGWSV